MKKLLLNMLCAAITFGTFSCCFPEDIIPEFSVSDIYGTWRSGTVYYRYDYNGGGETWDVADDVFEGEGQPFTWEIVGVDMTHIHIMDMGASVPKTYVIDELTPSLLRYHDVFKDYEFHKVY